MSSIYVINTEQKVNTGKKKNTKRTKSVNTEEENCWNYLLNLFRYKYLFVFVSYLLSLLIFILWYYREIVHSFSYYKKCEWIDSNIQIR